MRSMRRLLLLLLLAAPAFGKSLHWSAIDVDAKLDADGRLHVIEKQRIVFDGDWNGGERDFNIHGRQSIEVHSVKRLEGTSEIELTKGDLSSVDRWDLTSPGVVRWRSRMPSDPEFENREITYILDVTYSGVLASEGDHRYRLNHNFGMPKRDGVIERFTLYLAFDPVWLTSPISVERTNVPPGQDVFVSRELTFTGAGEPAAAFKPLPPWVPIAVILSFLAVVAFLIFGFIAGERATGRFAPVTARFDEEILAMSAEVAGAAWDGTIGAPEVAAVLARMTQEKKLSTNVEGKTLHMQLLVDRNTLPDYERALIDALFFSGLDSTSTDAVKEHYKSSGFDPAKKIEPGIQKQLAQLPTWSADVKRFSGRTDTFFILGALLLLGATFYFGGNARGAAAVSFFVVLFFSLFGSLAAWFGANSVTNYGWRFVGPAITMSIASLPLLVCCRVAGLIDLPAYALVAIALYTLAWIKLVIDLMRIRDTPQKIAFRKRIAGVRLYFIEQLALPKPALKDEWFPYVLAFGLGTNVDRWFHAHGGTSSSSYSHVGSTSSSSSSFSSSSSSSSWTGGGGGFGGAGATGSWAIAAGAMAAGVSAPSSSSSGGGGGGGSSSGGGGGGGW